MEDELFFKIISQNDGNWGGQRSKGVVEKDQDQVYIYFLRFNILVILDFLRNSMYYFDFLYIKL